jgi:hypothetical protein
MTQRVTRYPVAARLFLMSLFFAATGVSATATLNIAAGVLTYTAGAGVNNSLTISVVSAKYIFTESAETITLLAGATGAGWTGSGTGTVTGNDTSVSSIIVNVGTGTNVVNVLSSNDPITVNGGSGDDTVIANGIPGALDNLRHIPTGLNAGNVVNDNGTNPHITFTGVEHVKLVLQLADNDGARLDGTIGNDKFQFFHGASSDSGRFQGIMDQNNATGVGPFALTETIFTGDNQAANDVDVNFFNQGGTDSFEFNGSNGSDSIVVGPGEAGGVQFANTVAGSVVARLEVFNLNASITVNEVSGTNVIDMQTNVVPVTVTGGSGDDTLIANGNPGVLDNLRHIPTGLRAGTVVNDNATFPNITFTGIDHLHLVLQTADSDGARLDGTIGNDFFVFVHGATADAGVFTGTMDQNNATGGGPFPLTETTFSGDNEVVNDVDVNFFVPGGSDTFEMIGTANANVFTVGFGEAGGVQLTDTVAGIPISRLEVFNIANAAVQGGGASDVFNVVPSASVPISILGSLPGPPASPGDALNVDTTGTTGVNLSFATNGNGKFGSYTFTNRANVNFQEIETLATGTCAGLNCPLVLSAVARKLHGGAGQFDLPLAMVAPSTVNHNPTTEPRQGPVQTIVFTFNKPLNAATVTVTEGTAIASAPTFSGNDLIVGLSGVTDQQYVTISLTNVGSSDGTSGGSADVRIGFLLGDVNQNRVVTVADLGLVNAQLSQSVTAANYLKDVNASGTLTVADKGITNTNLTRALPTP